VAKSSSRRVTWELEPHTRAKHDILRRYLHAWLPIMDIREGKFVYIDGFAGPGEYKGGEPGSPLIALEAAAEHSRRITGRALFIFIEKDPRHFSHLEGLLADRKPSLPWNFSVCPLQGSFEQWMQKIDDLLGKFSCEHAPILAFIDPFGYSGVPFWVVKKILGRDKGEVLVNFAYNPIQRFIRHPDEQQQKHFDQLFGTRKWREALQIAAPRDKEVFLHDLYKRQLRQQAKAKFVRSFAMLDRSHCTSYYLFFATKHIEGLRKMKAAMWKVDPSSGTRFCDATDPRQLVLFEKPDYQALRKMILERFRGQRVAIEEITNFVLADTPFREAYYKSHVLAPLEDEGIINVQRPRNRGRKGTFPRGTIIEFS